MSLSAGRCEGFSDLIRHYEKGTAEIRYLLDKECEMLYECKWCREIFRNILTFTAHKRSACRSMYGDLTDELELAKKLQKRQREERGEASGPSRQGKMNLEAVMEERSRPVTVTLPHSKKQMELMTFPRSVTKPKPTTEFVGGYQRLIDMPTELAIASQVPEDRVVVVMPQEKSSRYGEMQLRKRRKLEGERYAMLNSDQMKILQRIPGDVLMFADIGILRCNHFQCKSYRPFDSFEALVYHLTLTHHSNQDEANQCYFCESKSCSTFEKLKHHLKLKHGSVRSNHMEARKKIFKRGYKRVQDYEHRSISPNGYVTNEENESDNASNNEVSNSPATPFLQTPIKIEQVDPDEMPLLKKAPGRRGRRRKRPLGLPKPTLSPAKIRPNIEGDELKSRNAVEFNIGNIDEFLNIRSNDSSLSNAKKYKGNRGVGKRGPRSARAESQLSNSSASLEEKDEKKIDVDELMETDSEETEFNEDGEPIAKRRKPVSLIKGRIPRQRAQTSRLKDDYVVPNKFASTTNLLSENQFRAFAKEQAKQNKKERRGRPRRKIIIEEEQSLIPDAEFMKREMEYNMEEVTTSTRKRGAYKRKAVGTKSRTNGSSMSHDEDEETDSATQLLFQQIKKSLTKASTPSGDQQKKDGSSSVESTSSATPEPSSQEGFILPPLETAKGAFIQPKKENSAPPTTSVLRTGSTNASPMKNMFPSVLTGSESELITCSPRLKNKLNEGVPKVTGETRGESASRRKQNFAGRSNDTEDLKLVQMPGQQPLKPDDLTQLPVTLSTAQRRMLFNPLKPLFNATREGADGLHQCAECGTVCKNLSEGQKHMVSHIRMARLKCSLCDAGSFFCTDMRKHLMYRYCEKLHYAPPEMVGPGTPCMDAITADKLIQITENNEPGRAIFIRGKIISAERPTPYIPDSRIEQRLLGALRAVSRTSPRKIVLTSRKKSPSNEASSQDVNLGDDSSQQTNSQSTSQPLNGDDAARSSKDSTPSVTTTNEMLHQVDTSVATPEFVPASDSLEKRAENPSNYPLPLTIRANPAAIQKTPSPDPELRELEQPVTISESQPEVAPSDSIELVKQSVAPTVRSSTSKPSILSRSPVKQGSASDSQTSLITSVSTPTFQPMSENTQASSSSDSSQNANRSAFVEDKNSVIVIEE